jgi:hypothetical protein
MKLAVILPGDYGRDVCQSREEYFKSFLSAGTELEVFSTGGTKSIANGIDFALIAPGTVTRAVEAEDAGFDGVLLNGT